MLIHAWNTICIDSYLPSMATLDYIINGILFVYWISLVHEISLVFSISLVYHLHMILKRTLWPPDKHLQITCITYYIAINGNHMANIDEKEIIIICWPADHVLFAIIWDQVMFVLPGHNIIKWILHLHLYLHLYIWKLMMLLFFMPLYLSAWCSKLIYFGWYGTQWY